MFSNASPRTRWEAVAAALVAAVVLGAGLLPSIAAAPAPTPTPAVTPTPSHSPQAIGAAPSDICATAATGSTDCIAPGTYSLGPNLPSSMTVTVPGGWFEWDQGPGSAGLLSGQGTNHVGSGWGALIFLVGSVPRNPCDPGAGTLPATDVDTPGALAAAIAAWPGFEATDPAPITLDGRTGVSVRLVATTAACASGTTFLTPDGSRIDTYPMVDGRDSRYPATFRIVPAYGTLLVVRTPGTTQTSPFEEAFGMPRDPNQHLPDQAELDAIVDSIRLGDSAPTPSS